MKCSASVRDREIEPAQPQRRQAEDNAENRADDRRRRQRHPEWRMDFTRQNSGCEGAGSEQARVTERDLPGIAGQQHQRQGTDRREKHLARQIEIERRRGRNGNATSTIANAASAPRSSRVCTSARS